MQSILPWLGDWNERLPIFVMIIISALCAVLCGGGIGWERQRAEKPAGFRTLILICLGSAIFTQAGIFLAGGIHAPERARVAAQIVTGIGFLGAGAIIRDRGHVVGITTGAAIWATSAVGMVIGAGYIVPGLFFTVLVVGTLAASGRIENFAEGPCQFTRLRIIYQTEHGKTRLKIHNMLDDLVRLKLVSFEDDPQQPGAAVIAYCRAHHEHHAFLHDLIDLPEVIRVESVR